MIEIDTRDDRAIGIHNIDRVQPPTQTDFEHPHIKRLGCKERHHREGGELKVRQGNTLTRGFDAFKLADKRGIVDNVAVQTCTLIESHQMWGGIQPNTIACSQQD